VRARRLSGAIAVAAVGAGLLALTAVPGEAKLVNGFCHPTGDYCVGVFKHDGNTKLDITTPSLTASYGLCAKRTVNGTRECHHFRFKVVAGGLRESRVDFQTRFGGPGRLKPRRAACPPRGARPGLAGTPR
jgi:hypothetical protein